MCISVTKPEKKIAIIGASSFIGRHILSTLLKKGYSVIATYRQGSEEVVSSIKKEIEECDACSRGKAVWVVYDLISDGLPEYLVYMLKECYAVFLCAWAGTNSRNDDELNDKSSENLFQLIESVLSPSSADKIKGINNNIKKIIYLGTQAEYGLQYGLVTEKTKCRPCSSYGKSKFLFGCQIMQLCKERNVLFYHFRLHSVYGRYRGGLLRDTAGALIKNGVCIRNTNCRQHWNYLFINDAVKALILPIEKNIIDGIYNIGNEENMTLRDYLEQMRMLINPQSVILYGNELDSSNGGFRFSSERFFEITGWKAEISFSEGIKKLLQTSEFNDITK